MNSTWVGLYNKCSNMHGATLKIENIGLWCRWYSFYFRFMLMSICFVRFTFLFLLGWFYCVLGSYFIINNLIYFIDWNIITLNSRSIIMTFLFDWISLLFMGFVFIISSLVILYSDDYMFGDLNIVWFILLVLMFVVSIIFLVLGSVRKILGTV